MTNRFQRAIFFLIGCVVTVAAIALMGAANGAADSPRYDADFDMIMGGLFGITVEVVDHKEDKAYLYAFPIKKKEEKGPRTPQLVATIDLKSAGKPTLDAKFNKFETDKKK